MCDKCWYAQLVEQVLVDKGEAPPAIAETVTPVEVKDPFED